KSGEVAWVIAEAELRRAHGSEAVRVHHVQTAPVLAGDPRPCSTARRMSRGVVRRNRHIPQSQRFAVAHQAHQSDWRIAGYRAVLRVGWIGTSELHLARTRRAGQDLCSTRALQ